MGIELLTGALAWCSLGLFAAFVAWTALSLSWTESAEKTSADLARVAGYLGVFALALFARDSRGARRGRRIRKTTARRFLLWPRRLLAWRLAEASARASTISILLARF